MLAKYSIRAKIITVVAFLLVALTGMGLLAVLSMRAINASTVDIASNWLPIVRVLGELRAGVITYRTVIGEHMLAETLDEKLAAEKTLAARRYRDRIGLLAGAFRRADIVGRLEQAQARSRQIPALGPGRLIPIGISQSRTEPQPKGIVEVKAE